MNVLRRFLADEGHARADTIFVGVICGLGVVLVVIIVTHAFGRASR